MTNLNNIIQLENYKDEDIFDVVIKLEKSFDLKFEKDTFCSIKTFGDLCDIITSKVQRHNSDDCTTHQGFYTIRNAIATVQPVNKKYIKPNTELQDIFPRDKRRQNIKELQSESGISINIFYSKS